MLIIKRLVQKVLGFVGLRLSQLPAGGLSGTNLFEDLTQLIPSQSPVCLDVGANIGQTITHLSNAFDTPHIHAFEPSSAAFKTLKLKVFGERVNLYHQALGSVEENREFINYERPCLSSFLPLEVSNENRYKGVVEMNREKVQVGTVDQFLSDHDIAAVDLLKIDTQGFDLDVLHGASRALKSGVVKYVLVELLFISMYEKQAASSDVIKFLNSNGLYLIDYYEKVRQGNTIAWCTALFGNR